MRFVVIGVCVLVDVWMVFRLIGALRRRTIEMNEGIWTLHEHPFMFVVAVFGHLLLFGTCLSVILYGWQTH
jgi:hypothetical protein